jgi:hypothetical protein
MTAREHMRELLLDVGATVWSRDRSIKGVVTGISQRRCAACGCTRTCYLVKWDDGTTTKPCIKGVGYTREGDLLIL